MLSSGASHVTEANSAHRSPTRSPLPGVTPVRRGLLLQKVGLGATATWAADSGCVPQDSYEIYEGTLGNFTSHGPVTRTNDAGHSWNFTPQAGNRYFLVVPGNATYEGSYGKRGDGTERPQSDGLPATAVRLSVSRHRG